MPAPMSEAPTLLETSPRSEPMPTMATISGSPVADKSARLGRPTRAELSEPQECGRAAREQQDAEEQQGERETLDREEAVEVEVHPRDDEVHGNEKAEPDPLESQTHDLSLG